MEIDPWFYEFTKINKIFLFEYKRIIKNSLYMIITSFQILYKKKKRYEINVHFKNDTKIDGYI